MWRHVDMATKLLDLNNFSWQWRTFALSNNGRGHVAAARSEWCLTLTPNNTKTIERMTYHCFLRPIRRDLTSSSYTIEWKKRMGYRFVLHVNFVVFFLPYLQDHGLLRSRNRATIATWRNDFSSLQANKTRKRHIYRLIIRTRWWPFLC